MLKFTDAKKIRSASIATNTLELLTKRYDDKI